MRKGRRWSTCHHEAGHALGRWYFGNVVERAVVLTVEDVRAGRWIEGRYGPAVGCDGLVVGHQLQSSEEKLIDAHAGMAAEIAYRKVHGAYCWMTGGSGDSERIQRVLEIEYKDEDEGREANLLANRIATTLIRSRPGAAAIKAMATALMERGEIDGDEIKAICREAYGGREPDFGSWDAHWPPTLADIRHGVIHEVELKAAA